MRNKIYTLVASMVSRTCFNCPKEKLLSFVITEGVNTILPMYPNELYKNKEENFSDIRLTFVSTTKKGEDANATIFW